MPKIEAKSGKSTDCAFKLFGRTIAVKGSSEGCIDVNENSVEHVDEANEEKVALKKPTKLVACPRCESMDTKFCYFNNYNVNQPRHYCRKCQRYWTAGGALRNVPVGAGRRKNKPSFGIHQGQFIEVSENEWTNRQPCIPLCLSGGSDKLVKTESIYPELRFFDQALTGAEAEAAHAQGKPKPQSHLDGYSHILIFPSKESSKHVGVGLCGIELHEKCTHLGKGAGNGHIEKRSCSSNDKTQLSATKAESLSEVVQTVDDVACDSSVTFNAMVAAVPKSEPQNMSPNDFSSSSSLPSPSSVSVMGNRWPVYYNGCTGWGTIPSSPSDIWGVQLKKNDVPWCPQSTGPVNWPVPLSSMWGQQCSVPLKALNVDSDQKKLGKHERDESPLESTGNRSLWEPKTQRLNHPGQAFSSSLVENLEKANLDLSNQLDFFKHFNPGLGK